MQFWPQLCTRPRHVPHLRIRHRHGLLLCTRDSSVRQGDSGQRCILIRDTDGGVVQVSSSPLMIHFPNVVLNPCYPAATCSSSGVSARGSRCQMAGCWPTPPSCSSLQTAPSRMLLWPSAASMRILKNVHYSAISYRVLRQCDVAHCFRQMQEDPKKRPFFNHILMSVETMRAMA